MEKINGFIAAPFTPMNNDGSVNFSLISEYADYYKRNGIDGAFICGTTGEGVSLTLKERTKVTEKWMEYAADGFKIIVHVACNCMQDIKYLVAHSREAGVYGIASMSPIFFKPVKVCQLVDFCADVAGEAPDLPFYFYHIPSFTGVCLSMIDFLGGISKHIPNFAGIKYTHGDIHELSLCVQFENGKYDILHGQDETFLCGLIMGVTGGVGGTYNHVARLYRDIRTSVSNGDLVTARELQLKSQEFITLLNKYYGNVIGGKRMMKLIGLDCGPNRDMSNYLTDLDEVAMRRDLEAIGFFDYCNKVDIYQA